MVLCVPVGSADSWTETSQGDFLGGTATDVTVTLGGDVTLALSEQLQKQGVVLDVGGPGAFDSVRVYQPFVLRESDGTYKMWYTGFDGNRFRMMFADSPDGIVWTKRGVIINVLTPPWNFDSVAAASVLKEGATYHMWFTAGYWSGGPAGYWAQIYYATSSDGQAWSIQGPVLGLGPAGSWDDALLNNPWVFQDPTGVYRMYYSAWDTLTVRIGLATSSSHTGFTRYAGNPILDPGPAGSWDDTHVHAPAVVMGTPWRMYYTGADGSMWLEGFAESPDGLAWSKSPANPYLRGDPAPAWDRDSISHATHVWDPSGERLYYSGAGGGIIRVGLALPSVGYSFVGSYESRVFDSGGAGTVWQTLAWGATTPAGTSIDLFARAGDPPIPDGTWSAWTPVSGPPEGAPLALPRARFVQYRAALGTADDTVTPELHEVSVTYARNGAPVVTASQPASGQWLRTTAPTLLWSASDPEGDGQTAFAVELSRNPGFSSVFSSGTQASPVSGWQSPALEEGVWYWRVRVADGYGAWSGWRSDSFGLDVTPPRTSASLDGTSVTNGLYTTAVRVTLAATDATSGVASTVYRVDGGPWQSYAGPFVVSNDGARIVEFFSTDNAGVEEAAGSVTFRIDTNPLSPTGPFGPWLFVLLIGIIAAFLALLFLLARRRKREGTATPGASPPGTVGPPPTPPQQPPPPPGQ